MSFDVDTAHIVYASDDKFAEILGVSLVSLFENSKDMPGIAVYILDSGISEDNRQKINLVCEKYGRGFPGWIPVEDISRVLSMEVWADRGSLSQYARLFVSSLLPEELDRVLYLDCDIILQKSVRELWHLDLQGKTVGALMDAFSKYYRANIGLQPNDVMFNSGVMLIDLKRWKERKIEEKLLQFIALKRGRVQQGDQGALNAVLSRDIYCFEPRFNSVTIFHDFTYEEMFVYRKPPEFYSEAQVKEAMEHPNIIHFTTSFLSRRPWVEGCRHRYLDEWLKYKRISPWKDSGFWKDNRPGWKRGFEQFYKTVPRGFAIRIAGFLQAYGRPLIKKFI